MATAESAIRAKGASSPGAEYARRLQECHSRKAHQEKLEGRVGAGRVAVFLGAVLMAWLAFGLKYMAPWWLAVPGGLFLLLLFYHDQVLRAIARNDRCIALYERGQARLEERWMGKGEAGTRFLDEDHVYAADLDLFGPGSLFELLCTARTAIGETTLANWLRAPSVIEVVRARQKAVQDLQPRLDLREDLALLGANVPLAVDLAGLSHWGSAPPVLVSGWERWSALGLAVIATAALIAWGADWAPLSVFLVILLLEGAFAWRLRSRARQVLGPVEKRLHELVIFHGILARVEREPLVAPRLVDLQSDLKTDGVLPSERIAQLLQKVEWLNAKRNQLFLPIAMMLLWETQFAFAIEAWRARCGKAIERWLQNVGEFEALSALAAYAYENPNDPFADLVGEKEGPCVEGEGLGHPLLPRAQCVRNDLRLNREIRALVISGSNMSGKSTFLRTVGVNVVLGWAGAPVRARRLRLSAVMVGGTLRIQDSLQAGKSRFYAEITRIRQLVDVAKGKPSLLFLLDEIFHGTNSHDRRLGAEGIVRSLLKLGAIGMVTTHDLALADIADLLAPHVVNVHFEDQFKNDAISFDYLMRPGVVQHSNALALMRAVGLEI